jgi:hypothetical protein
MRVGDWVFRHLARHDEDEKLRRPVLAADCISAADRAQKREADRLIRREDMRRELDASYKLREAVIAENTARRGGDELGLDRATSRREATQLQLDAIRETWMLT